MTLPRAVLDVDIIYSRVLHELMGRAATSARLFDLVWSEELIGEAIHALVDRKGTTREVAAAWVGHMQREFPGGKFEIGRLPAGVVLSELTTDPDDEHICALAVVSRADYLLTFDTDFRKRPLAALGIQVTNPDEFLTEAIDEQPEVFERLLVSQAAAWGGGRPLGDLLEALERAQVRRFVTKVRDMLRI